MNAGVVVDASFDAAAASLTVLGLGELRRCCSEDAKDGEMPVTWPRPTSASISSSWAWRRRRAGRREVFSRHSRRK